MSLASLSSADSLPASCSSSLPIKAAEVLSQILQNDLKPTLMPHLFWHISFPRLQDPISLRQLHIVCSRQAERVCRESMRNHHPCSRTVYCYSEHRVPESFSQSHEDHTLAGAGPGSESPVREHLGTEPTRLSRNTYRERGCR